MEIAESFFVLASFWCE